MARWVNWCAAALVAGAMAGCGGDGGAAVTPLSEMRPGEKFAMETPLLAGGGQVSHYVVYGVTPEGALVDSDRPGLLAGERVPILEYVERDGRRSDTLASPQQEQAKIVDPTKLQRIQVEFYQQLWNAVAEHEGTRDPQAILAEIDDLDGRVVDLMDDVDASGVSLAQYLAFYDLLDEMPRFANKELPELNLREALADASAQASIFDEQPPACPPGTVRVTSRSHLLTLCRTPSVGLAERAQQAPAAATTARVAATAPTASLPLSVAQVLAEAPTDAGQAQQIQELLDKRASTLDDTLAAQILAMKALQLRTAALTKALADNGQDDQRWRAYCAQPTELDCQGAAAPGFGQTMAARAKALLDSLKPAEQMEQLRLQSLIARRNEAIEAVAALLRRLSDQRAAVLTNMR